MIVIFGNIIDEFISREDSGHALIADLDHTEISGADDAFFVRLHSWSDADQPEHKTLDSLRGKRVKITLEVVD